MPVPQKLTDLLEKVPTFENAVKLKSEYHKEELEFKDANSFPITDHPPLVVDTPIGPVVTMNIWCPGSPIAPYCLDGKKGEFDGAKLTKVFQGHKIGDGVTPQNAAMTLKDDSAKKEQMELMAQYLFDMMKAGATAIALQEVPEINTNEFIVLTDKLQALAQQDKDSGVAFDLESFKKSFQAKGGKFGLAMLVNTKKATLAQEKVAHDTLRAAEYGIQSIDGTQDQVVVANIHGNFNKDDDTHQYVQTCLKRGLVVVGDLNTLKEFDTKAIHGTVKSESKPGANSGGNTYDIAAFSKSAWNNSRYRELDKSSNKVANALVLFGNEYNAHVVTNLDAFMNRALDLKITQPVPTAKQGEDADSPSFQGVALRKTNEDKLCITRKYAHNNTLTNIVYEQKYKNDSEGNVRNYQNSVTFLSNGTIDDDVKRQAGIDLAKQLLANNNGKPIIIPNSTTDQDVLAYMHASLLYFKHNVPQYSDLKVENYSKSDKPEKSYYLQPQGRMEKDFIGKIFKDPEVLKPEADKMKAFVKTRKKRREEQADLTAETKDSTLFHKFKASTGWAKARQIEKDQAAAALKEHELKEGEPFNKPK